MRHFFVNHGTLLYAVILCLQQDGILAEEAYLTPPKEITDVVLAPRHRNTILSNLSPDGSRFLIVESAGMPSLADLAKPHYNLGGVQIDPAANRARSLSVRGSAGIELVSWADGKRVRVEVPTGASVSSVSWSPNGKLVGFFANFPNETHIYVADVETGRSRRVSPRPVLATMETSFSWSGDGSAILAVLIPNHRAPEPPRPDVPAEPKVRVSATGDNRLRTYPSLLQTPRDKALLEYFVTGQLALIPVSGKGAVNIGAPSMFRSVDLSPDGRYARVTIIQKPFSYIVPVSNFGSVDAIWDLEGKQLVEISKAPLREGITQQEQSREDEKRNIAWRPDGKGLSFLQMEQPPKRQEGEDERPQQTARRKDRVMQWLPPFDEQSMSVLYESETRISSVQYSADCQLLFLTESSGGQEHLYAVRLAEPSKKYTIYKRRTDDFYGNPGNLMTKRGPLGVNIVRMSPDSKRVYLSGTMYSKDPRNEAPRPFIDAVDLESGEKKRIFESDRFVYEQVAAVLDDDLRLLVLTRQSRSMLPNSYLRDLRTGETTQLTNNVDYAPFVTSAIRKQIQVTRIDGFKFWVNVTLPYNYVEGTKLPALFWIYPSEYVDQKAYDESKRTYNLNQFPSVGARSVELLTLLGYAVVQPDCPIVGPTGRINDNYVPDLRNDLWAAIDALDNAGYIDVGRLAVGGHSYGAFSAVNAMVHTPFFKAGIAGDGAYNRLLTPLGFQNESRSLWEARETYLEMSPFLRLERFNGALLLYHGMDDQNVGTFPINSERLFHALDGLGKTVALYMYPFEDHSPASVETNLDLWARWIAWLDKYVRTAGK